MNKFDISKTVAAAALFAALQPVPAASQQANVARNDMLMAQYTPVKNLHLGLPLIYGQGKNFSDNPGTMSRMDIMACDCF